MFPADCHKKPHLPLTFPQIGRWINKVCIISCSHGIFYDNFFLPWPSWSRNNEARCCIQPHAQMWWTLVVQNMTLNSFFYCLWLKGCVLPVCECVCVCVCVKYWLRPCRSIDIHPRTPVNTRLPNPLMFNMIVDPLISTQRSASLRLIKGQITHTCRPPTFPFHTVLQLSYWQLCRISATLRRKTLFDLGWKKKKCFAFQSSWNSPEPQIPS